MKKRITLYHLTFLFFVIIFCFLGEIVKAQNCLLPNNHLNLEGNNISADISNGGNLFFDGEQDGRFVLVGDLGSPERTSIFASGLWLGAKNQAGELKVASADYNIPNQFDYAAGPILNENSEISFACENYDRLWEVLGYEIVNHLIDFQDDGIVQNRFSNIYSYPALGNPHFENLNGFSLPDAPHGYAPFYDENNDGLYNPDNGDFPLPDAVNEDKIPNHLIWGIFNDGGAEHTNSGGEPLYAEVQLTAWSFNCTDNDLLNNTIFTSYKITNQGNEDLDSLQVGLFTDFDIGCSTDDYIGSAPDLNTFYGYNSDATDGMVGCTCNTGVATFCETPPAQAITFLNYPMSSFTYFRRVIAGIPTPFTFPLLPQEYSNYLNGRWRDGTPFTAGGDGYGGTQVTNFAFFGNPNDVNAWSMFSTNPPFNDRRVVGSVSIENFAKGESITIDLAHSFHLNESLNHLEIVNEMYEQIPLLQEDYNNGFTDGCTQDICLEDCVWTGDANKDSIVNTFDLLQVGLAFGENGTARNKPLIWHPYSAEDWNTTADGVNLKHTDASGNAVIDSADFLVVETFLGKSYKRLPFTDVYQTGDELQIVETTVNPSSDNKRVGFNLNQTEEMYGLTFTVEYDTTFLRLLPISFGTSPWDDIMVEDYEFIKFLPLEGEYIYSVVKMDGQNSLTYNGQITQLRFTAKPIDFELVQTAIYLKNIKAILNDGTVLDYGASNNLIIEITNPDGNGVLLNDESLEKNTVSIFPNPASDFLNVHFENATSASFTVFDLYGNVLLQKKESTQEHAQIPISDFPQGIYFLKIQMEGEEEVKKFLKH